MKILHIIPRLTKGGAERLTIDIIRELSTRSGITPMLLILDTDIRYDISHISEYVRVIPSSVSLSVLRPDRYQIKELQRFVDEFKPDIINSHLFYGDLLSKVLICPGAKHFSHVHSNMPVLRNLSWQTLTDRKRLDLFSAKLSLVSKYKKTKNTFIAVSHPTLEYLKTTLPESMWPRIVELQNAINYNAFNAADNERNLDTIRIVNTGSFNANKNQKLLVEVADKIRKKGYDVSVTFVGEGGTRKDVMKYADDLGISEYLSFAGSVEDVPPRLADANLYVHTSFSESFGLVLIEAMAAGLPVVTLNGKGNANLIKNGMNGYMINDPDADIFVDRILDVFRDKDRYKAMKKNAIDMAHAYDIVPYTDRLLDIYLKSDKTSAG